MKKLIAITGMDGVGKNSVMDALVESFPRATTAEIWQPMYGTSSPFSSKQAVDRYLCSLTTEARSLFLAHALWESTQQALRQDADILFLNAYYYKYFATELAMGAPKTLIEKLITLFPKPDLVIEITCPIEQVVQRKKRFSRYECGCAEEANAASFAAFQSTCSNHWEVFKNSMDVSFDNGSSKEALISKIQMLLKKTI
jgi:thymidylate kinase